MTAEIGSYIKALREARNYSGRKLGMITKVSHATISRIEDDLIMPSPDTLRKLAGPLGVSYTDLMEKAGYLDDRGSAGSGQNSGSRHMSGSVSGSGSVPGAGSGAWSGSGAGSGSVSGSAIVREREMGIAGAIDLAHIENEELKKWIFRPDSADYLVLAKKISDLGIDPKFVDNVFISKIFKSTK